MNAEGFVGDLRQNNLDGRMDCNMLQLGKYNTLSAQNLNSNNANNSNIKITENFDCLNNDTEEQKDEFGNSLAVPNENFINQELNVQTKFKDMNIDDLFIE